MKKFVNAIIRIPLEIVNGEINQSYSECATFSFEWIDKIPQKQNFSQAEIIKQLYSFLKNCKQDESRVLSLSTTQSIEDDDDDSTLSYIEESDDDDDVYTSIGQDVPGMIEDVTETPVKMDSLMDIMNIFIKREDLTTRKKPKNSSFKKRSKRKSHRAYTAKNYDETEDLHDGNGR